MFCFGNDERHRNLLAQILADNLNSGKIRSFVVSQLEMRQEKKSAKHEYFESESFNDVLSPPRSVRLMREQINLEFFTFFQPCSTPDY